jgi:3-deoxy-D-manno-octulosonate 8-phosphate phosphatase (KDO 8-P phosphatase)
MTLSPGIGEDLKARVLPVRLMIFDVDGVLTDGRIFIQDDGSEIKAFDVQDGHGIKLLQRAGVEVALITGRSCKAVNHRAVGLGISRVYQNVKRKLDAYHTIVAETRLSDEQVGYMGDDLIDIPVMRRVGWSVTVPNAAPQLFPYAHYVTRARGGWGAAREVCDLILQVQGHWEEITRRYFQGDPLPT